jgi:hypothetical protein
VAVQLNCGENMSKSMMLLALLIVVATPSYSQVRGEDPPRPHESVRTADLQVVLGRATYFDSRAVTASASGSAVSLSASRRSSMASATIGSGIAIK